MKKQRLETAELQTVTGGANPFFVKFLTWHPPSTNASTKARGEEDDTRPAHWLNGPAKPWLKRR